MHITSLHTKYLGTLIAVPVVLALLTGCSSNKSTTSSTSASTSPQPSTLSADDWALAFAKCMRAEGIDYPDPGQAGAGVNLDAGNSDATFAASTKCMEKLGKRPAPAGGAKTPDEVLAAQLASAKCFRDNGFDVQDPKPNSAMGVPTNAPDDVMTKCLGASTGAATAGK